MRIITETDVDRPSVGLAGRFDAHETAGFRAAVEPLLSTAGSTVRIDLANVVFVDSTALAELLHTQKTARSNGAELVLVNPSDPVRIILELTALQQVFTIESVAAGAARSS